VPNEENSNRKIRMAKEGIFYSSDSLCIFMIVTFVKEVALLNNSHKEN